MVVVTNDEVFDIDYLPEQIVFRDSEIKEIIDTIKTHSNLFIYGPSGVGKTVTVKFVLKEIKNSFYVNCWVNNTKFLIASELANQAGLKFVEGKSADHLILMFKKAVNPQVIVFDEIDKANDLNFLYKFVELFPRASIILISNSLNILNRIDPRVLSRLMLRHLLFDKYNKEQLVEILKLRAKYGLKRGAISKDLIRVIAQYSIKTDLRQGIRVLYLAGMSAENKITMDNIREAIKKLEPRFELDNEDKVILNSIKGEVSSGELYELYKSNGGKLSYRSFKRHLDYLAKKKIIKVRRSGAGFKGQTTFISV